VSGYGLEGRNTLLIHLRMGQNNRHFPEGVGTAGAVLAGACGRWVGGTVGFLVGGTVGFLVGGTTGALVGGTIGTLVSGTIGILLGGPTGGGTKMGSFVGARTGAIGTGVVGVVNGACGALGATGGTAVPVGPALTTERSRMLANSKAAGRTKMKYVTPDSEAKVTSLTWLPPTTHVKLALPQKPR
jgi:hypothetical protein